MVDFGAITRRSKTLGRILKLPLHLIPKDAVLPVMQGALAGQKWVIGSSLYACWLGSYEMDKQKIMADALQSGAVVYDVGANVGFYTLLAAKYVGEQGHVYAFEPFPRNVPYIQRHADLNGYHDTVTVYEAAVGDHDGTAHFELGAPGSHTNGRVADEGELEVRLVSLDHLSQTDQLRRPDVIKIDVEGGEVAVLQGARRLLTEGSPTLFVATHGDAVHQRCLDLLAEYGYAVEAFRSVDGGGELIAHKEKATA